jgi:hypothetical protein
MALADIINTVEMVHLPRRRQPMAKEAYTEYKDNTDDQFQKHRPFGVKQPSQSACRCVRPN